MERAVNKTVTGTLRRVCGDMGLRTWHARGGTCGHQARDAETYATETRGRGEVNVYLFFKMETSEQHTATDLVNFVYYPTSFV